VETGFAGCAPHYHFWLAVFACVAMPMTCMEFREQAVVQVTMTIARVVVMVMLIGTVIGGIMCDGMAFISAPHSAAERAAQGPLASGLGLIQLMPVCLFAFIFHHSAPGVAEPVHDKSRLPGVFSLAFIITGVGYLLLATIIAYYFGNDVKSQASLSWEGYVGCVALDMPSEEAFAQRNWFTVFLSEFILIFPALDVLSAFPLNAMTLSNNLATALLPPIEVVEMQAAIAAAAAANAQAATGRTWMQFLRLAPKTDPAEAAVVPSTPQRPMDERTASLSSKSEDPQYFSLPVPAAAATAPDADSFADSDTEHAPEHEGRGGSEPVGEPFPRVCFGCMRRGTFTKLVFRTLCAGLPILGAAFIWDLGEILSWTGLVGVAIGLTVPALLRIRSMYLCEVAVKELWLDRRSSVAGSGGVSAASPMYADEFNEQAARASSTKGVELMLDSSESLEAEDVSLSISSSRATTPVEDDDLVECLRRQQAADGVALDGMAATPSKEAIISVLHTPFDHSVLGNRTASWALVAFSGVMAVVVVVGLVLNEI
jgi:hypothetical protein